MAVTRAASIRLARPRTAFCSCRASRDAAQPGGHKRRKAGIAAKADDGGRLDPAEQRIRLADAGRERQPVLAKATGERPVRVAELIRWISAAGKPVP